MRITVACFGVLRERVPGAADGPVALDVADHATVGQVADLLSVPRHLATMVLIDGRQAGFEDVVPEGSEVTLMPPFAGGAN
ncbi:MAG: MoaD/ThiS family protein [Actinomycetota bacterium]|nr:MoaD/ThiS family protein [Actinomycetota bacterium]